MKKLMIGAGIVYLLYRFSTNANATEKQGYDAQVNPYKDKAVQATTGGTIYKIVRGLKVKYTSQAAWVKDGSREIIKLSSELMDLIPEITNAEVSENGYKQT